MRQKNRKNLSQNQRLIFIIILVVFLSLGEGLLLKGETKSDTRKMISLFPVGNIEKEVLEALKVRLKEVFLCEVETHEGIDLPQDAYSPSRNQHSSSFILKELHKILSPGRGEKVLAISDVDLYVPQLNFVFGEAELGGPMAIISLSRLRQSFYGLPENKALFLERTVKEAIHELGHVYGLGHCPNPECVMHFSNSLLDTDRKEASFCKRCQKKGKDRRVF